MRKSVLGALVAGLAALIACSGASNTSPFQTDGGASGSGNGGSGGSGNGSSGSSSGVNLIGGTSSSGGSGGSSSGAAFVCAPSPSNYDIPNNGCDDDGDGKVDNVTVCDNGTMPPSNLASAGTAADMLAAMGICQVSDSTHWGIVSATYTNGHTQTGPGPKNFQEQHGTLGTFGTVIKSREGSLLGVLSSGSATVNDSDSGPEFKGGKSGMQGKAPIPNPFGGGTTAGNGGDVPTGFPKTSPGCAALSSEVNDVIDVKASIKVPANAKGFSFDFDFWSGEWPDYVCTQFNDSFIAYLTSSAFNGGAPDNISFDTNKNTISVDNNFFQSCTPNVTTGCDGLGASAKSTCSLGAGELAGTGFGDTGSFCGTDTSTSGGATSWLTSTAPATPGETIAIEFLIWDTGDESYDSSVLLDNWTWQPQEVAATPITQPSQPPK